MNAVGLEFSFWSLAAALSSPLIYGAACILVNRGVFKAKFVAAFVAGFAASYIAFLVESVLFNAGIVIAPSRLFFGFLTLVAVPEEVVKLAALLGLATSASHLKNMGLLLACFIGCGFAASENVIYLEQFGSSVLVIRFFTATAFHAFNAILMARIVQTNSIADESMRIVAALTIAVLMHGAYDYFLTQSAQDGGRFMFVLAFSAAAGFGSLRARPMSTA